MFSRPEILFLVSLLFVALLNPKFNPYLPFKFLIFYHSSIYSQCIACLKFFSTSVINDWNSLPDHIINAPSISSFKEKLDNNYEQ